MCVLFYSQKELCMANPFKLSFTWKVNGQPRNNKCTRTMKTNEEKKRNWLLPSSQERLTFDSKQKGIFAVFKRFVKRLLPLTKNVSRQNYGVSDSIKIFRQAERTPFFGTLLSTRSSQQIAKESISGCQNRDRWKKNWLSQSMKLVMKARGLQLRRSMANDQALQQETHSREDSVWEWS